MTTVRDLQQILSAYKPSEELRISTQTKHSTDSTGIYVRVALVAAGFEILTMWNDNREENKLWISPTVGCLKTLRK